MLKGAHYAHYKYDFSGDMKLVLPGFKTRAYHGFAISAGPPDYKIQSFGLDVGGLTSGWRLANSTNSGTWVFDRPTGNLRLEISVATPEGSSGGGGAATLNRFGTFIDSYTFSTRNALTVTPLGAPSFADYVTSRTSGAIYIRHLLKRTGEPIASRYRGVSLDIMGIGPGMSLAETRHTLAAHYKAEPHAARAHVNLSYKTILFLSSQPYVTELDGQNQSELDMTNVYFGNPTTGDTVVGLVRNLMFNGVTAQRISDLAAALRHKYGPATAVTGNADSAGSYAANGSNVWFFGEHGLIKSVPLDQVECPTEHPVTNLDYCNSPGGAAGPNSSPTRIVACVQAVIAPNVGEPSRAASLKITVYSLGDTELANGEAMRQLHAAAIADYGKYIKPAPVPTL